MLIKSFQDIFTQKPFKKQKDEDIHDNSHTLNLSCRFLKNIFI